MSEKMFFHREEGFTLTELMLAFLVFTLLIAATFQMLNKNIEAAEVYVTQADVSQDLREASNALVDQIRTANDFDKAEDTDLVFQSYITGTDTLYNVEFLLQDGDLIYRSKRVSEGVLGSGDDKILVSGVTSLDFDYYDIAGTIPLTTPVSSLSSITRVEIKLSISRRAQGRTIQDAITTTVRVRV